MSSVRLPWPISVPPTQAVKTSGSGERCQGQIECFDQVSMDYRPGMRMLMLLAKPAPTASHAVIIISSLEMHTRMAEYQQSHSGSCAA